MSERASLCQWHLSSTINLIRNYLEQLEKQPAKTWVRKDYGMFKKWQKARVARLRESTVISVYLLANEVSSDGMGSGKDFSLYSKRKGLLF